MSDTSPPEIESRGISMANSRTLLRNEEINIEWQIPAIGNTTLTPEQAEALAEYLDENANEEWLSFILLGEDPCDVANGIRAEIERAETDLERQQERVEELRKKHSDE
jgi:hypothetical protein